jgi:large conductance mechanosensitive channel
MGYLQDFKKFVSSGDLITIAVAFVMAVALNAVVTALVTDFITPLIGVFFKTNLATATATVNGSTFAYGDFLNKVLTFLIDALVVFFLIVVPLEKYKARQAAKILAAPPTTRACPECQSMVPIAAKRCAFCAQPLPPG